MDNLTYRFSTEEDKEIIERLLALKFGTRDGSLLNLNGRYYLAFNELGELVAMTGISSNTKFNGLEVDWTCTHDDYIRKGVITDMIRVLIKDVKEDVYCSCWRWDGQPINLRHTMVTLGFMPVLVPRIAQSTQYSNCAGICTHYNGGVCKCFEDLYVRRC